MREELLIVSPRATDARGWKKWHFGAASLDERTLELIVGGEEVALERKPLAVLIFLLNHAGEVCTKDELLEGVWSGRVLSETVLTKCIGRLREVLGDKDQEIIRTAYGFGYRLVAPVRVESIATPEPSRFDFRAGQAVPGRQHWSLVERLGVGGHGEAWRGRHEKTNEVRVFKFALDEQSLAALKREITLFRVINDSLGDHARVTKIIDWNLEQPPYFLEAEFINGGSLSSWLKARGGVASVPLAERLELLASVADAVAAVHSLGVLHKDLKPSNILVRQDARSESEFVLADFGSGGVLDMSYLEKLGITRLGFTKTLTASASGVISGTPMYLAPEVLAGQPFTVKADIYALGVILYQLVVGDFARHMTAGWEREIEDELLREDIALLAEGNPAMRLADAEQVARRLRSLSERREKLRVERDAEARAERTRRLLERARARRVGFAVAFGAVVIGFVFSTLLYLQAKQAKVRSEQAAARALAVTNFLSRDVFAPVSGAESVKNLRVAELLTRAGSRVDVRFAGEPDIAAELHYIIGKGLDEFAETEGSVNHFNSAFSLGKKQHAVETVVRSAAELIDLDRAVGKLGTTISDYEQALAWGSISLKPTDEPILNLRLELARGWFLLGEWQKAADRLAEVRKDLRAREAQDYELSGRAHFYAGQAALALDDVAGAQSLLRDAIRELTLARGEKHIKVTEARSALGRALIESNQYGDARRILDEAEKLAFEWETLATWSVLRPRIYRAILQLENDEIAQARVVLGAIVDYQDEHTGERPEIDHTGAVRQALGESYRRTGELERAVEILRKAVLVSEFTNGAAHPLSRSIRLSLAEALLAGHRVVEAQDAINGIAGDRLAGLPDRHTYVAQLLRVRGLLALEAGQPEAARRHLNASLQMYEALRGADTWRARQVRQDLIRATH